MRTRHSLIAVAALSVLTLAGCDKEAVTGAPSAATPGTGQPAGTGGGETKKDTPADPKSLLSNAARTSKDSGTYKFEYKLDTSDKSAGTSGFAAKGEVDVKNGRFRGTTTLDAGSGQVLQVDVIGIGTDFYLKSPMAGTDKWSKMNLDEMAKETPGAAAQVEQSGKDPLGYLDKLKEYASSTPDGTDTVRGRSATRYKVVVDKDKVLAEAKDGDKADPVALLAAQGDAKLWLDSKGRVVQFTFSATVDGTAGGFKAELYDYDQPVSIEAPAASEIGGN